MLFHGIEIHVQNKPAADPEFVPFGIFMDAFLQTADQPVSIAVERENGNISVFDTKIHSGAAFGEADLLYMDRVVKFMLWSRGGFRIYICGDSRVADYIQNQYAENGMRAFDRKTMSLIYEKEFEVRSVPFSERPQDTELSAPTGGSLDGCRIGMDVGGSNIKVCAAQDGKIVFHAVDPWQPLQHPDPDYHLAQLVASLRKGAAALPQVDAIGISTAGIYVNNRTRIASIFRSVPQDLFQEKMIDIYPRACAAIGERIPFVIANDGDVAALAGSIPRHAKSVVGISMGTSEAGGYVDSAGNITGRLNEFAFVPLDLRQTAPDSWSGDYGCGVTYLSSEAVARLAAARGIAFRGQNLTLPDQVREAQRLVQSGEQAATDVFDTIGCYLAHAIYSYSKFYEMEHVVVMGGITAGPGGAVLLRRCRQVLQDEYPAFAVDVILPDEESRAAGQSFAAATLVKW